MMLLIKPRNLRALQVEVVLAVLALVLTVVSLSLSDLISFVPLSVPPVQ